MESEEELDYMSDKLLEVSETNDVRPGLLFNNKQKRSLELYKKRQELLAKKPKTYHEQQKEVLEKGLNTAISAENKGFQLLAKMGFKEGTSLGKSQSGLVEPINVILKEDNSGLGAKQPVKKTEYSSKQNNLKLKEHEQRFRAANAEKNIMWILRKDFYKAQRICEELDSREKIEKPVEEFYWTKDTIQKLKNIDKESDDESEDDNEEDYDKYVTESNLFEIIDYLRNKYLYCVYCAFTAANQEDLTYNCPGPYRVDHDEL